MKNTREQMFDLKKECDQLECSRRNLEEQFRHLQVRTKTLLILFYLTSSFYDFLDNHLITSKIFFFDLFYKKVNSHDMNILI